jgi:hypothetical protein
MLGMPICKITTFCCALYTHLPNKTKDYCLPHLHHHMCYVQYIIKEQRSHTATMGV